MAALENILRHPMLRLLFLLMLVWSVLSLLNRLFGTTILLLLIIVFVAVGVVGWMLKHKRSQLAKIYPYPGCQQFINVVCKITQSQPPVEGIVKQNSLEEQLLLNSSGAFRQAEEEILNIVRGHDFAVSQILARLRDNYVLRSRIQLEQGAPPVAAFLLLGEAGIGKRHLAIAVGRRLYRQQSLLTLSMRDFANEGTALEALVGNSTTTGILLSQVRARPYHTVILEDLELACPSVLEQLTRILTTGIAIDPASKSSVSFQHCVFFMTASLELSRLRTARDQISSQFEWLQTCSEILATTSHFDQRLLSGMSEFVLFEAPSLVTRAEVILLLAERECRKYGVNLQYVDPAVLADEVAIVSTETGFELAPARMERLLKRPLVRAAKTNSPRVSLRTQDSLAIHSSS